MIQKRSSDNPSFEFSGHISETAFRNRYPKIFDMLLLDRTASTLKKPKNIIWANDNYIELGEGLFEASKQIKPHLITGNNEPIIMPRALKHQALQKERTKSRAEVFTPVWIVKKMVDEVDKDYKHLTLEDYLKTTYLEITCGEAPFIATRYDMGNGEIIPIKERVGFLDRKLSRINAEVDDKAEWQHMVGMAYKSTYGYEWNGDSLLLARENLLFTYYDYYIEKWGQEPIELLLEEIAYIITYNIFQMDGLTSTIPLSKKREKLVEVQLNLFFEVEEEWIETKGTRVKIMNWQTNRMEYFDKGAK